MILSSSTHSTSLFDMENQDSLVSVVPCQVNSDPMPNFHMAERNQETKQGIECELEMA